MRVVCICRKVKKTSHVYNHPPSGGGYRHDNCIFFKLNIKKYTTPRRGVVYFENGVLLFVVWSKSWNQFWKIPCIWTPPTTKGVFKCIANFSQFLGVVFCNFTKKSVTAIYSWLWAVSMGRIWWVHKTLWRWNTDKKSHHHCTRNSYSTRNPIVNPHMHYSTRKNAGAIMKKTRVLKASCGCQNTWKVRVL